MGLSVRGGPAVDWDEFDPARWPEVTWVPRGRGPGDVLAQWRVVDALDRLGLANFPTGVAGAALRLWRRGRRTDAQMADRWPAHVHVPRWVNCLLSAAARDRLDAVSAGGPLAAVLDEELVRAAEAVARMTPAGAESYVAIRAMLTGEPAPHEGGWRAPP